MPRRASRVGFTLLEVIIASVIFLVIMGVLAATLQETADVTRFDMSQSEASVAARRILQQVSRELAAAGGDTSGDYTLPDRATGGSNLGSLTFREKTSMSVAPSPADWTTDTVYTLQDSTGEVSGNAIDDDKDGVVDERTLVRTRDGLTVVLDESVTLFRIDRAANSDVITVTLEVSRAYQRIPNPTVGDWVAVRLSTNVLLGNTP